jgi:tryptophan synthase alpha chain
MELIHRAFLEARRENRAALIPFLTGGFPDLYQCQGLIETLDRSGADMIEVGIPFSDPLADGPVIQFCSKIALEAGATPEAVLEMLQGLRGRLRCPLVVMTYWNPVLRMGMETFIGRAEKSGASGVMVPDLPPEEASGWVKIAGEHNIATIFFVSPTTTAQRLDLILSLCSGFVYYVSITAVTGSHLGPTSPVVRSLKALKAQTDLPVAVGFGISRASQVRSLASVADGIIIGSELMRRIISRKEGPSPLRAAALFARRFRAAASMEVPLPGKKHTGGQG